MESNWAKLEDEKEDRISDLPDHMIHHILSFLPSTKDVVRTGILSKRWKNQWTRVPVLIFNSNTSGLSSENFLQFVDNTLNILHDCSKINKFKLAYSCCKDPKFSSKIRFATRKGVEDLCLWLNYEYYVLPKFLFRHASLVTLNTTKCRFKPNGKVNWECLTGLFMKSCRLSDHVIDLILSGSPLLEKLHLRNCHGFKKLVIVSKSLISLLLDEFRDIFDLKISCPKLQLLDLEKCLNVRTAKLLNLSSSVWATIDFHHHEDTCKKSRMSLIKDILNQLRHLEGIEIGVWFMENMSAMLVGDHQFSPVFNIKSFVLDSHNISVIAWLLRNSTVLDELYIDVTLYDQDNQDYGENYWSDASVFNGVLSHMENIKITGFPRKDSKIKVMLNFIQFFLKNATVLKNIVVEMKDDGTDIPLKDVPEELLSFPRCSQSAIIEFVCSK